MNPSMDATTLHATADGPIGHIVLDRADVLNALSLTGLEDLAAAARWFDEQPDVRAVVVSGAGRAFSAGADLSAFTQTDRPARDAGALGLAMTEALESMRAVTVAAVHGHCVGGGLVLALACDIRLAATSTRFAIPEVDLGIPLTWGAIPRLVREIGPAATRDLVLSCRPFDADEALRLGLVSRVVGDDELLDEAESLASALAGKAPGAVRQTLDAVAAAAEAMVSTEGCWADPDVLATAFHDPEGRAAAARYLEERGR